LENSTAFYEAFLMIVTGMGKNKPKDNEDKDKQKEPPRLSRKDTVAIFIAALESLLLPIIILAVILLVVAVLLFIRFPGR